LAGTAAPEGLVVVGVIGQRRVSRTGGRRSERGRNPGDGSGRDSSCRWAWHALRGRGWRRSAGRLNLRPIWGGRQGSSRGGWLFQLSRGRLGLGACGEK
jgi:hypothetical protein